MDSFLLLVASFVFVMVASGLIIILQRPGEVDRLMAAQLLGTGGVAILLILAIATKVAAIVDVALMLALFAAFAAVAFVRDLSDPQNTAQRQ
ncbi:monovalent cation/H+ antiporter complex subunit F [Bradyrhizobium erythrophlei]|jgi:multicomponent Na+:H+ antiporter subunit F|uniref:Multisubunit sodium/proton antiporter, MrpF subunit n=1 Tax=Bradyrhizobium erythrophlei TaxID=1437360 RepID=A0A1M5PLB4_9BRAD|nr:monovalent cation/H+ antiporter complex subunit F [Bradyrhizobium erythrophlei]SHH02299.1 multisubunit sodium/proton antiporter, MrpF subunit [Bradyrhizobium erythrophlei]